MVLYLPKGLELMLELTIGNHDQHFLDNWYSKLKQFSLSLMKDIVKFCDKTIDATTTKISTTESSLKSNTNQEQFKAIQSEIKNNKATARKILQQRKFKKYNTLKYKLNATTQPLTQKEDGIQEKQRSPLYSDILKRKKSNTTKGTFQLLNKNLNFIPTPKVYNKHKINEELESFYRLLKLKAYFKDNENTKLITEQQIFQPQKKEKWTPNKNHHTVLTYIEATQRELEKEQTEIKEKSYNNLTKNKRTSMKELSEWEDIIITKADKGDAVVIVGVKDYIKEAERQLSNTENYGKLQEDPTATNMKLVNDIIEKFKN